MSARDVLPKYFLLDRNGAEGLRQLRWSYDVTLQHCAEALGIDAHDFLEKERGRKTFSGCEFAALASLFGLSAEALHATLRGSKTRDSTASPAAER